MNEVANRLAETSASQHKHVVITLHGIETVAPWQKPLDTELSQAGFTPLPLDYGKYRVIRLLWPWSRKKKMEWFAREFDRISREHPGSPISIIAHSFGTHITAFATKKYPNIKFATVILCGSIVPEDFPWDKLIENGQVGRLLNEAGGLDFWAGVAAYGVWDAGPSGVHGFKAKHRNLTQSQYPDFKHSDYLQPAHFRSAWMPFLTEAVECAFAAAVEAALSRQCDGSR